MCQVETLGVLDEIEALVADKLQVVSYKWLSRNLLISSNTAKRLLEEFVEKHGHGDGLEVVYTLSGWLKDSPSNYHIRLVSGPRLAEAREEFEGVCSVQVYSVQTCIPKDPAALWNAEFVQAEELFSQDVTTDNCLRDNRLCAVANPFVKRSAEGASSLEVPKLNGVRTSVPSKPVDQKLTSPHPTKTEETSLKSGPLSVDVHKEMKIESNGAGVNDRARPTDKEKVANLPMDKKLGKISSMAGGSLANLWGRASTMAKPKGGSAENGGAVQNPTEAQVWAHQSAQLNSDDEGEDVNFRRASKAEASRKRRVVFDFSDEEDEYADAVNLASPDLQKPKSHLASKQSIKKLDSEEANSELCKSVKDEAEVDKVKTTKKEPHQPPREEISSVNNGVKVGSVMDAKDKVSNPAPSSPKRRKVLKTRIDERGREVTEVVWEGEETKNANCTTNNKVNDGRLADTSIRPPVTKKSTATVPTGASNPAGKAGNKKTGSTKDPKQGNILSFFKRV